MAADAGLSVKERLALLQSGNKNPALSGPMKLTPTVAPKPKPPPVTESKPAGFAPGLKPVTAVKPPTSTAADKPNTSPNKPLCAVKPLTADTPAKPGSTENDHEKTNGENKPQFPKLRPVGAQPGRGVSPSVPKKPPGAPSSGQETPRGSDHTNADVMREKLDGGGSPKPMSLQEKLAALRQKADSNSVESKPRESSCAAATASPPPKSPVLPGPSNTSSPGVLRPGNGPSIPIKPSDIAKSLKSAADGFLLRSKEKASEGGGTSSELFLRKADGKKFRKVEVASVTSSAPAPTKPSRIDDVDLTTFVKAYAAAKEAKLNVDAAKSDLPEAEDGEMDELYIEAESTSVTIRTKGSLRRASSVRVSKIPELTEEEEEAEDVYTDGTSAQAAMEASPPDEFYDDCVPAAEQQQQHPDDPDEIYEPLDEIELPQESQPEAQSEPPPLPSPNNTDDKKAKKEKEKEKDKAGKKHKEEINKKEERERKKKEEEIRKQRHKFGLNDADEKVGDGVVKSNAGASFLSKYLAVTKGEIIAILRMDHNPAGKWLVQNDQGKIGFVNANNIEVSTPTIRHVMLQFVMDGKRSSIKFDDCLLIENGHNPTHSSKMAEVIFKTLMEKLMTGAKAESVTDDDPEELYEPLPDEGEMDELYEAM